MGVGFRPSIKCGFPIRSVLNSPSRLPSSSVKGREASFNLTRLSFLSVISEEGDILYRDPFKAYAYSPAMQILENGHSQVEGAKTIFEKGSHNTIDDAEVLSVKYDILVPSSSSKEKNSRFSLLLENLNILEESFADSDALNLERDILLQLGRLGALKLFNTCLRRTLADVPTENIGECKINNASNDLVNEVIIRSGKKQERKSRRERASSKIGRLAYSLSLPSEHIQNGPGKPIFSSAKKASNFKSRRLIIARNEAEMSRGVKMVSELEKIRTTLEEETGRVVSWSCWAEAAGLDMKELQQQVRFGWYCRDELIRSTRSLVLYFARNYKGMGISLEDLLQAGNLGVLQGAERFDHTRGYRFSTYVQYWIRKSMSKIVTRHARGIQIPCVLSRAINQIQKARKALSTSYGKHADDSEIAKFTGLSLAKIESASKCPRVVGSIDKKIGDGLNAKYLEFMSDMSIQSPEEAVMRQHMIKDIHDLLRGLESRERQVLILRYGLKDHQPKSLEEIGKLFHVSKEWVRRLEKKVMTRLRSEETCRNLRHYMNS
ncbi:hypothetical protein P3X46_007376 [Hevea brasiliensis]|uniref:RNA polymerase sigma-70 domain-containing protein n=1 Tax=Hevea brasiliensis TaxID=3981 RepID=A0ABQ9MXF6_HEVBR|nr:RNA polymerase sigma factor sigC-like isoform X1 [Hevea brasiliensis]KAJ9183534.1 hypothetical protein P3X46_007376 [Hevea brasiliensis]